MLVSLYHGFEYPCGNTGFSTMRNDRDQLVYTSVTYGTHTHRSEYVSYPSRRPYHRFRHRSLKPSKWVRNRQSSVRIRHSPTVTTRAVIDTDTILRFWPCSLVYTSATNANGNQNRLDSEVVLTAFHVLLGNLPTFHKMAASHILWKVGWETSFTFLAQKWPG